MDEIEVHLLVLVADASHLAVVFTNGVVVALHADGEMALVVAELVGLRMVAQPGELQAEGFSGTG